MDMGTGSCAFNHLPACHIAFPLKMEGFVLTGGLFHHVQLKPTINNNSKPAIVTCTEKSSQMRNECA